MQIHESNLKWSAEGIWTIIFLCVEVEFKIKHINVVRDPRVDMKKYY